MNEREQLILNAIIQHYLEFGECVGSRTLEKKYRIGLSSATIRNTMADLEDRGLIAKTHTSSGRVPTSEAYRLYVDELIKIRGISNETKAKVIEAYNKRMNQIDMIFEETSRLLSKISQYAAIVIEPSIKQEIVKKVRLVHISDTNILAVVVLEPCLTKNINIYLESPISEDEIEKIDRYLNDIISKTEMFTLVDLKEFFANTEIMETDESHNLQNIDDRKIFFESGNRLFENHVSDAVKVIDSMKFFNNPSDMKAIFSQFIQAENYKDGEVNVIFGEDLDIAELEDFSFVFSVYTMGDSKGIIGVIGPKRMEYSKTVGLVEYVSEEVQQILKRK